MSLVEFHPKMVNKSIGDARKELARKDSVYQGLSIFYKVCIYIFFVLSLLLLLLLGITWNYYNILYCVFDFLAFFLHFS
jgi:hypothetical protein